MELKRSTFVKTLALGAAFLPALLMAPATGNAEELTDQKAAEEYQALQAALLEGYGKSGNPVVPGYKDWKRYNTFPYVSSTHGGRYVNNYANELAKDYGKFEDMPALPVGAVVAKDSFKATKNGIKPGPLFLMEKMEAGFNEDTGDWKYTLITPNGKVFGETNGVNSKKVMFCADCHAAVEEQDYMFFLPDEYRVEE